MIKRGKWAFLIALAIIVSMGMISTPVAACFGHYTECEGQQVYQGDGGATDYWYDDLYPSQHGTTPGTPTEWIIHVWGGYGCSNYEHATITDNAAPAGWTTSITMHSITTGSFTYITGGGAVNVGDDIEGKEFYIGLTWDFHIKYTVTPSGSVGGGEQADMICTVNVVGYVPENQHDYVYVHCTAFIDAVNPPTVTVTFPNGGESLSGTVAITWDATDNKGFGLSFDILLSSDSGLSFPTTLVTGLGDIRTWSWDTTPYPDDINYRIKIIVFDTVDYSNDISDNDFAIDNVGPDCPCNLKIGFGLTTSARQSAIGVSDTTGSDPDRLLEDDGMAYSVIKTKAMEIESFDTGTQNNPVTSATLTIEYWVENTDYTGNKFIMWKKETDPLYKSTGIQPLNTEVGPQVRTYDLYAQGVDTINEIAGLDIYFENNDGQKSQMVNFDYIWVTFTASTTSLALTWDPSPSPDIDHYDIWRSSPDTSTFSLVGSTDKLYWNDAVGTATDHTNYFYRVKGVDTMGADGPPTYIVGKYVKNTIPGWNMFSTPLEQQVDTSMGSVLQSINGNYDNLWTYHAGYSRPWLHWQDDKPASFTSLSDVTNLESFYLYQTLKTPKDLITIGKVPSNTDIQLEAGWNLIGYPNLITELRDNALSSIAGKYNHVYTYDSTAGREVEVTALDTMSAGNGYWIHTTEACTLTINTPF
jgi:hypothetical protein